jgi:hypothetical protein
MPYNIYLDLSRSYSTVNRGRGGVHDDLPTCPELIPLYQDSPLPQADEAVIEEPGAIDIDAVAQRKWLRQLDEEDGCIPVTHDDDDDDDAVCNAVLEVPATTGQLPPLPQAAAAVLEVLATTGQPPPLLQAVATVLEVPATTGQLPPLPQAAAGIGRRAASRQPTADYSGKPCGCGCGKILEQRNCRACFICGNGKLTLSCYGNGKQCISCSAKI